MFAPLLIIFVILKLTGVIDWSWGVVLAPVWVPFVFGMLLSAVCGVAKAR